MTTTPPTETPFDREELRGLLVDPESGAELRYEEGWLWSGTRKLYPVFDGVPIIQPQGMYKVTGLLHRCRQAQAAIETASEGDVVDVFAPEDAAGREKCHAANRHEHYKDAGELFWGVVSHLTKDREENRHGWTLDVGCGYGFDMVSLCRESQFVVGIDPQIDRCVTAKRLLHQMGFENFFIMCGTGEELPLARERFNLVTANQVVEHMAERPRAFREINRVLARGGQFVFALPTRYSLRPEPHVYLMFLGWLPRELQGWYARLRGRSDRYAEYTNLISNRKLSKQLRAAFGSPAKIRSAAEVYTPKSALARRVIGLYRFLANTPLRPVMLEIEGAMVGSVAKKER